MRLPDRHLHDTFGAVMFTGYHGSAGTPASVLAHTYIGIIQDVRLNAVSMGEYGINAAVAGHFGVPVALVAGDNTVVAQAQGLLGPDVVGVEVKRAAGTYAAVHLHPEKAREAIRAGVSIMKAADDPRRLVTVEAQAAVADRAGQPAENRVGFFRRQFGHRADQAKIPCTNQRGGGWLCARPER